jgi:transposase
MTFPMILCQSEKKSTIPSVPEACHSNQHQLCHSNNINCRSTSHHKEKGVRLKPEQEFPMKRKAYKTYSREFKLEAVRLSGAGSKPVAEVARELGVHRNQIARWKVQLQRDHGAGGEAQHAGDAEVQDELGRLRRENLRLTEENALLRKAAMLFAREAK